MSRSKSLLALIVLPVALLLAFVSVGVANARMSHDTGHSNAITIPTITISNFSFKVPATVLHGAKIKVVNNDNVLHTVTSNVAGKFNVSVPAHQVRYFRAPVKGTYGFHCNPHPSMKGTLHVR